MTCGSGALAAINSDRRPE